MTRTSIINDLAAAELLTSMETRIDDGIAASRPGDGSHGGDKPDSHPERMLLSEPKTREQRSRQQAADHASGTYQRTHALLAELRAIEADWWAAHPEQRRIPGQGPAPQGRCEPHWRASRDIKAQPRHTRCTRCADFHEHTGYDYPAIVLDVHAQIVAILTADGMNRAKADAKAWDHPRVIRAWRATGWRAKPGDRYPERQIA